MSEYGVCENLIDRRELLLSRIKVITIGNEDYGDDSVSMSDAINEELEAIDDS